MSLVVTIGHIQYDITQFAQWAGVRYETAWRWFKVGQIEGYQLDSNTIVITEESGQHPKRGLVVVAYAGVFANEHRPNRERQVRRTGDTFKPIVTGQGTLFAK